MIGDEILIMVAVSILELLETGQAFENDNNPSQLAIF